MADTPANDGIVAICCPCCEATLWLDKTTGEVIKSEKAPKKKSSLDDLWLKEKKKAEGMDHKLEASFELQKKKHEDAEKKFKDALTRVDEED